MSVTNPDSAAAVKALVATLDGKARVILVFPDLPIEDPKNVVIAYEITAAELSTLEPKSDTVTPVVIAVSATGSKGVHLRNDPSTAQPWYVELATETALTVTHTGTRANGYDWAEIVTPVQYKGKFVAEQVISFI